MKRRGTDEQPPPTKLQLILEWAELRRQLFERGGSDEERRDLDDRYKRMLTEAKRS